MMEPTGILCANCTHDLAWHHTNGNCKNACHCGGFVYSPELDGTREMAAENTRLDDALLATSNELTDATAQINELNEENRRLLAELEGSRDRFCWVEQHVTSIHVGFMAENPVCVDWIDDNGNDREGRYNSLLDMVEEQLRLAEMRTSTKK